MRVIIISVENPCEMPAMTSHKTVTFAIVHMSVAFAVVYLLTGSLALGGSVALIEPAVNTVAYFFHEKMWERFGRRRTTPVAPVI